MADKVNTGRLIKGLVIMGLAGLIAGFIALMAAGLIGKTSTTGKSGEALVGKQSPSFEGLDIGTGRVVSLADYEGMPIMINFWASWCPPCRSEAPGLERIWRENIDTGLVLLGVNVQDDEKDALKYLKDFGITFPNILDHGGQITIDYGVTGLPVTFFVNRDGRVLGRWVGAISESGLVNNSRLLLDANEAGDLDVKSNKILYKEME